MLKVSERFWAKVDMSAGPGGCWLWTAGKKRNGYGVFALSHRQQVAAHRYMLELGGMTVPADLVVRHDCDNPTCCNPGHLRLGTHAENSQDMVLRARQARGEEAARAKLTVGEVQEIRHRHSAGDTLAALGRAYDVTLQNVWAIVHNKTWRHI